MAKDKSVNQESEEKPSGILAFFRNDKGSKIIVALGIAGILFIFLSSMFSKQKYLRNQRQTLFPQTNMF